MLNKTFIHPDKTPIRLTREGYGEALAELGKLNTDVVVLDADLAASTYTKYFKKEFPERFFEMGISEADMVCTAAGLSLTGFIPFLSSYAMFLAGRAWDQIRNTVDYSGCNVKIAAAHGGISVGKDGPSHQSMEDISNMLSLVNMTVMLPCDYWQTKRMTHWAANYTGPVYYRMGREKVPNITTEETEFIPGKAQCIIDGKDGTIIATGTMVAEAVRACDILARKNIHPRVLNMHTLKPLDEEAILKAAAETGFIVTAEEHSIYGGLASLVCRVTASSKNPVRVGIVAIENQYLTSGDPQELMQMAGLTAEHIAEKITAIL